MIVQPSSKKPFDQVNKVGVAICGSLQQRHSAFLFRIDEEQPQLLHLAWHCRLFMRGPGQEYGPDESYLWADIAELESEDRRVLASILCSIGERKDVPYGLNCEGLEFDLQTGELRPHPDGRGFTCASFILSVLRSAGYPVIDLTDWPTDRPGDTEWKNWVVDNLAVRSPHHAKAVERDLNCLRIRPEEVVGSAATNGWEHQFPAASALGLAVISDMKNADRV